MKKILTLLSACLLFFACNNNDEPAGPAEPLMNKQDSLAIVAFYHSMKCAEWKGGFHWDLKDTDTWGGLTVEYDAEKNEYRVVKIEVPVAEEYLPEGYSLPAELGDLTALRELYVWGDHRMAGGIPPEIFNCPLEVLWLVGRYGKSDPYPKGFNGTIPKEIGKVGKTLKWLCISNTNIGGDIPEEITALQNLEGYADLSSNEFTGKVPLCLRELPHGAYLGFNNYTEMDWRYFTEDIGVIPEMWMNCLSGTIPDEVLNTQRWEDYNLKIYNQRDGYGYDRKYFEDLD